MMSCTSIPKLPACLSCRAHTLLRANYSSYSSLPYKGHIARNTRPSKVGHPNNTGLPARTRFAPSPTGYLHLGSLRTALYNYLFARATNGQFILRLEDTDQSRIVLDAEERLYDDLKWSGLSWDEGPDSGGPFGPYKQSLRLRIYQDHANRLLQEGKAFRCFCSHDDITTHNKKSLRIDGTFGGYPGLCLSIPPGEADERAANGEAHTIRFKSSSTPLAVRDVVYGVYQKKLPEDHFIIMKSDGFPTYHFANVVDDHLMEITHVIRGAEWLISTTKHVNLYDAFGWQPPEFVHVGLLVDSNRQKLSKRNMDIGIDSYRKAGISPPALLNFVALLGWNPTTFQNKGVMTLNDMVDNFGLKFTKGDIVVNMEKLSFLHKRHIRQAIDALPSDSRMIDELLAVPILKRARDLEIQRLEFQATNTGEGNKAENPLALLGSPSIGLQEGDREAALSWIYSVLKMSRNEFMTASQAVEANKFILWRPSVQHLCKSFPLTSDDTGSKETTKVVASLIKLFIKAIDKIEEPFWTYGNIQSVFHDTVKLATCYGSLQVPTATVYKYLRWALLGMAHGPQIAPLVEFLGKQEAMKRLQVALSIVEPAVDQALVHVKDIPQEQIMGAPGYTQDGQQIVAE